MHTKALEAISNVYLNETDSESGISSLVQFDISESKFITKQFKIKFAPRASLFRQNDEIFLIKKQKKHPGNKVSTNLGNHLDQLPCPGEVTYSVNEICSVDNSLLPLYIQCFLTLVTRVTLFYTCVINILLKSKIGSMEFFVNFFSFFLKGIT